MHGQFHVDAFLIFLLIGSLVSLLTRTMVHRLRRWTAHVNHMRKLAGGTLVVDREADFWLKKINDPAYVPQWRWTYSEEFKKMPSDRQSSWLRKLGYLNIMLVVIILLALLWPSISAFFGTSRLAPPIEVATKQTLYGLWNLTLVSQTNYGGYMLNLDNTTEYRPEDPYLGGLAGVLFRLSRTDAGFASASVLVNFTSFTFKSNDTAISYVSRVWWFVYDNETQTAPQIANVTSDSGFFGIFIDLPGRGYVDLIAIMEFRSFDTFYYRRYVTISSFGGTPAFNINIFGGHYHYQNQHGT